MALNFELKDSKFRSWFCVLNNPEKVWEGVPKDIAQNALAAWLADKPSRTGAVAYCISAQGLHHLHMVLEDSNKARFSAIKKAFPSAHLEPTMGNKQQADDYINKRGAFAESGEQVICVVQHGEIQSNQGKRTDIAVIETLLDAGYTPNEILNLQFSFRRYDRMIKDAYFDRRYKQTAVVRDVKVYWHVGESGSGKSYTYKTLCDDIGDDKIYFVSDYDNGYLDKYNGEPVLFLDEFRGQIRFGQLLSILGNYRVQLHSRYSNTYALWSEVHITSVLPPEFVYSYIDKGIFLTLTNKHLPVKRKKLKHTYRRVRPKRAPRGTSIEKRPADISVRDCLGHWEMDCVVGKAGTKKTLLVLTERYSRFELIRLMPDKTMASVVNALDGIELDFGTDAFRSLFKSVTVDNGSEFSDAAGMERSIDGGKRTSIYFCHPYSAYERGSNENANKLIRRHYPKGTSFERVTHKAVRKLQNWINHYPREIFGYRCAADVFEGCISSL